MHEELCELIQQFKLYLAENCPPKSHIKKNFSPKNTLKAPANKEVISPLQQSAYPQLKQATQKTNLADDHLTPQNPEQPLKLQELNPQLETKIHEKKTIKNPAPSIESNSVFSFSNFSLEFPPPRQISLDQIRHLIQEIYPSIKNKKVIEIHYEDSSESVLQFLNDLAKALSLNCSRPVRICKTTEIFKSDASFIMLPLTLLEYAGIKTALFPHSIYSIREDQKVLTMHPLSHYLNNTSLKKALWETLKKILLEQTS